MSSLKARRLNHLESAIRAASGEQIVTIERLVAEVASMRVAEVALARRTEATRAERRCPHCGTAGAHLHGKDRNDQQRFRCRTAEHRRVMVPTITPVAVKVAPVRTKRRQKGRLGLGRVNAHHGQIKALVNGRCRGVATQYLGNYLGWHRAMLRTGFTGKALLDRALA